MITRVDVETRFIMLAESYVGVSAPSDRFLDLVCPHGPADFRHHFATPNVPGDTNSGCGVVGVGFLRELCRFYGLTVPELEGPLPVNWWTPVTVLAHRLGCYYAPGPGRMPTVGSLFHVAVMVAGVTHQHWRSVVGGSGVTKRTVDGGAKTASGHQTIVRAQTELRAGAALLDVASQKPVIEWIDVVGMVLALLAERDGRPVAGSGAAPTMSGGAAPTPAQTAPTKPVLTPGPLPGIHGIDVSGHQPVIDYETVVRSGIQFAFVKATDGKGTPDPYFEPHCRGFRKAGLPLLAAYHYQRARHLKEQDIVQQVDEFLGRYIAERCELSMLDVEREGNEAATALEVLQAMGGARFRMHERMKRRWIQYNGAGYFSGAIFAGALDLENDPNCTSDMEPSRQKPPNIGPLVALPWKTWQMWQWAGSQAPAGGWPTVVGRVPGIPVACDRILYRGTVEQLRHLGANV